MFNEPSQVVTMTFAQLDALKQDIARGLMLPLLPTVDYGICFLLTLCQARKQAWFNTRSVSDEVNHLLCVTSKARTSTKPHSELVKGEMHGKGFWHKHFLDAKFLGENVVQALKSQQYMNWLEAESAKLPEDNRVRIPWLAHYMTIGALEARAGGNALFRESLSDNSTASSKSTGEWIVYKPHIGKLYFLSIALHGDKDLFAILKRTCEAEFPFLFA